MCFLRNGLFINPTLKCGRGVLNGIASHDGPENNDLINILSFYIAVVFSSENFDMFKRNV